VQNNQLVETFPKTIRFELDLLRQIEELAEEQGRDFSKQVKFMLKKYLQLMEKR